MALIRQTEQKTGFHGWVLTKEMLCAVVRAALHSEGAGVASGWSGGGVVCNNVKGGELSCGKARMVRMCAKLTKGRCPGGGVCPALRCLLYVATG